MFFHIKDSKKYALLMLDAIPFCCQLWDENINIIDCNEAAISLYELKSKQEYIDRFYEFSPKYQLDGRLSKEKFKIYIKRAFAEGRCVFGWMHQMLDGTPIPTEVTLIRVKYKNRYFIVGYFRDLREHTWMMSEIEQQNKLLQTVNCISAIMLQSNTSIFENDLIHSMGIMAQAVDADRVYIWKNRTKDGQLYCSQLYEWSEGAESMQGSKYVIDIPYREVAPNWEEKLSVGHCINGLVRNLTPEEQSALSPQGILSILVVPIFLKNKFWGFVGFDDCHKEHIFPSTAENILRSASQLIANALIRNEEEARAQKAEEHIRIMLDATPLCCQLWNRDLKTIDCNEACVRLYGFKDKQEYIKRWDADCSPEYQPDGQRSQDKASSLLRKAFAEGQCVFEWMHQMPDGTPIPSEVTLVRVKYEDDYAIAGYTRDLRIIKRLEGEIYYDALTGIYNRRYLDENLNKITKVLSRASGTLSLLMIDIDYFKLYNDTYGHSEGDNCLKTVAKIISNSLTRASDFVARYGGEEFTVVLPNTDEAGMQLVAEKLLKNILDAKIPHCKSDIAKYVTISIGCTTGNVSPLQGGHNYINQADAMLYISKKNGRNRYSFEYLHS